MRDEHPDIQWTDIDITEHPEIAVKYRVMSTPAIAVNGRLAFTGVPHERKLKEYLEDLISSG
jgi:hypothetical protein